MSVPISPDQRNVRRHRLLCGLLFTDAVTHLTMSDLRELVARLDRSLDASGLDHLAPPLNAWADGCDPADRTSCRDHGPRTGLGSEADWEWAWVMNRTHTVVPCDECGEKRIWVPRS